MFMVKLFQKKKKFLKCMVQIFNKITNKSTNQEVVTIHLQYDLGFAKTKMALDKNIFFLCSIFLQFSSVQSLSHVRLCVIPWTAARQASLSITNSQSPPKPISIVLVMPSNHLILCRPFSSCPQSLPASGSFQMSQLSASGGQSTGVSASALVLPVNTQDWSPLGWTGWISLQSKGLSRVFSNTIVQKHQFFSAQLSL